MSCPDAACSQTPDIIRRNEQKQVDTLMVADLAHLSLFEKCQNVVVVCSDTDIWPGILLCVNNNTSVLQIHTEAGGTTQGHLLATLRAATPLYAQVSF
jgi:uncharacterized LabA/DUF88 family protein